MKLALRLKLKKGINHLARREMKKDMLTEWAVNNGMMVMGVDTPYGFLQKARLYHARDISHLLTQDVLLLAGSEDHLVPLHQYHQQKKALKNVRSLEGRILYPEEQAQNHCQLGNYNLVWDHMMKWIDGLYLHETSLK